MMRLLKIAAVVLLVLVVLAVVGARVVRAFVVGTYVEPQLTTLVAEAERHWPKVQADLEAVKADPFFTTPREGGDAGALLATLVPFGGVPDDVDVGEPKAALPRALIERLRGSWLEQAERISAEELAALDFGWMKELGRYGYWSLERHPAFGDGPIDGTRMPMPDISTLAAWAKLRLLDGHRRGELAEARREVRHLAWLTITTEYLLGAMGGVALLGLEEKARATFTPDEPEAAPARAAYRRAVWAINALEQEALPAELRSKARSLAEGTVAYCPALSEAAIREPFVRPFLHDRFPDVFAARDATIERPPPPCRLTLAKRTRALAVLDAVRTHADAVVWGLLVPDGSVEELLDWALLGPLRQATGLYLFTIAQPDAYRDYRDAP